MERSASPLGRNDTTARGFLYPFGPRAGKGVIFLLSIHKTIDGKMTKLEAIQDGCLVNLTYPSED